MNWTLLDFITAGVLIGGAGSVLALTLLMSRNLWHRLGVLIAVGTAFMLVWANLAVGIIGEPNNNANLLYFAAAAIAPLGAAIASFKARGTANAMFATAVALAGIGAVALALGWGADAEEVWPRGIMIGSGFFGAMFAASGWLFLQAAKTQPRVA